jgi:hypothetical protein
MDDEPDGSQDPSTVGHDTGPAADAPRPRRSDRHRSSRRRARGERPAAEPAGRRRRSDVRRRRRRRTLTKTSLLVIALTAVAVVVLVVVSGLADRARELVGDPQEDLAELPGQVQPTLAIITRDETDPDAGPRHIAVFAHDRETGEGTVLFVPPSTVADVPGHGSFGVGEAFAFGDAALVGVTLENLLGIQIDEVVDLSRQEWGALLGRVGGYEIDVPSALSTPEAQGGQLRFEEGRQHLDGERLAEYLAFRTDGESELDVLPRLQRVLQGLLDAFAADPDQAGRVLVDSAPLLGVQDVELVRDLFLGLAEARSEDRLAMLTLPVSPLAADRTDAYRVDADRLQRLVDDRLAASRPDDETGAGRSLQVLNGVGTPGVGQAVAQRLQPGGYRVLLTGNADSFDYDTTRIVIYDDSPEQLAVARDIRERLGVGEIERSGMPQSVVDVTIIVGADLEVTDRAPGDEAEQLEPPDDPGEPVDPDDADGA